MRVVDPGHVYYLKRLDSTGFEKLRFCKRSSRMIDYHGADHPGTNTQELLRVIIDLIDIASDRSQFLNDIQSCNETLDAIAYLGMSRENIQQALFFYEARALRRKREKLNREAGKHQDEGQPSVHRDYVKDIPFTHVDIEKRKVGEDGHLLLTEEELELENKIREGTGS